MFDQLEASRPRAAFRPPPGSQLFRELDTEQARTLIDLHGAPQRCAKDTQLIRAGDRAAPLLTLVSGWAFRYSVLPNGKRQILSLHLPGDTIGLDTLLSGAPTYPVQSATPGTYLPIRRDQALRLIADAEWFRSQALDALARDRAAAETAMTRLGQCNAEQRVASVLLELYQRLASRQLAAHYSFELELTQQHIADLVGLTVVHLNRVLTGLKAKALVATVGNRVSLLDVPALECLGVLPDASQYDRATSPKARQLQSAEDEGHDL